MFMWIRNVCADESKAAILTDLDCRHFVAAVFPLRGLLAWCRIASQGENFRKHGLDGVMRLKWAPTSTSRIFRLLYCRLHLKWNKQYYWTGIHSVNSMFKKNPLCQHRVIVICQFFCCIGPIWLVGSRRLLTVVSQISLHCAWKGNGLSLSVLLS